MSYRSRIQAIFITIAGGAVIAIAVLLFLHFRRPETPFLKAGSLIIPVSIADNDASREQGLSGTTSLAQNAGKIFVFQQAGNYGFWMKDMHYALDFVWIDSNMKIIGITPNVGADTYPQVFYPPSQVEYVLEVNAGFSTAHQLNIGQSFTLQK